VQVPTPQSSHDNGIALERLMEERGLPTAACTGEASTFSHTGDTSSAQP